MLLITGVALYFVGPSLLEVLGSWDQVSQLEWWWFALAIAVHAMSFACLWALQRIALRTNAWLPVITSQLAGNVAARLLPGGPTAGAAAQFTFLRTAGISTSTATSGLTAAGILQLGTTLALPLIALPAVILGAPAPRSLLTAAWLGAALFAVLLAFAIAVFIDDRPLTWIGRLIDSIRRSLRFLRTPRSATAKMLLAERDALRGGLDTRWTRAVVFAVSRALFDYLTLIVAIAAFGVEARPSLVLLAFAAAALLALIPLTPGGLGFVEAGLTGTLALAGLSPAEAVSAALLYRLVSFWLPLPIGVAAGVFHRAHYGGAASPQPQ
ncbi:MAG: flippase-like domain-containing protein [Thermoleophilia bacterium]|nr:flippase-like domain-containing protein [Thermoleophilia bacterium]MDH3724331.1 flippase-like domain-containing protein [Thermoleophilia bacterium]